MRILYLSPCGELGGAERCLLDMLASLRSREPRWKLFLICGQDGPLLDEARRLGVDVQIFRFPARLAGLGTFGTNLLKLLGGLASAMPDGLRYVDGLRQRVAAIRPDIIHSNGFKMHVLACCIAGPAPVVWHMHDYATARLVNRGLLRFFAGRCRGAIAISGSVAKDAEKCLAGRVPIFTILNGVDLRRFRPNGWQVDLDAMAELPAAPVRPLRVGLIATFAKWKGHEVFLRALARPELRDIDIRGYVVGGPIYRTANSQHSIGDLRRMARELGIEARIGFTGFVEDVPAVMRSLDIVVHASTAPEPFGLAIAEAMACGKAIVASRSGGATELFSDGQDAIGVRPDDSADLAAAILRLANDPISKMRMGLAARVSAEARFNRARLGPELSGVYRKITCESSTSTAAISTAA